MVTMARTIRYIIILCACIEAIITNVVFHRIPQSPKKKKKTISTHPDGDEEFRIDTEYEENLEQLDNGKADQKSGESIIVCGLNIHVRHLLEYLGKWKVSSVETNVHNFVCLIVCGLYTRNLLRCTDKMRI